MRKNGFILIILGFATALVAGDAGYLPSVGPVALRFEVAQVPRPTPDLTALEPVPEPVATAVTREEVASEVPTEPAGETLPATSLMQSPPVTLPENHTKAGTNLVETLIGPAADTSNLITPQTFLRFFTPAQGGVSREAVVVPAVDFNPGRPPAQSSTAVYKQSNP